VVVEAGSRRWLRIINPGDSYQCSSDPRAHFGLGAADKYDAIHVRWPDGREEVFDGQAKGFDGGKVDRVAVLEQGRGRPADPKPAGRRGSER
jgi:hypothetical protein